MSFCENKEQCAGRKQSPKPMQSESKLTMWIRKCQRRATVQPPLCQQWGDKVTVVGTDLEMELDTGASVSLISEDTWTRARLFTYTDKMVGATKVNNGRIVDLPPVATEGTKTSLLGRE